jgi:hypothetical protein
VRYQLGYAAIKVFKIFLKKERRFKKKKSKGVGAI